MSYEQIFDYAGKITMIGWILLIFVPTWKYTRHIVQYGIVSILLSALYAYLIFFSGGGDMDLSAFGTLEGVMGLFIDHGK